MNLSQYIVREFNILPTPDQLKMIKKLAKQPEKVSKEYQMCVDFWLKEFHPDWDYKAMHGKHLKEIINKIKRRLKDYNKLVTEDSVLNTFIYICQNLPDWYKDKDLPTINSKFNEITEAIKRPKNNSRRVDVNSIRRISQERYNKP